MEYGKIKTFLALVALIMSIVALALNKWEIKNHSNTALNQERGLWKMCGRGRCVDLPMASHVLMSVRVLMMLGILTLVVNVVFSLISIFTGSGIVVMVGKGTSFLGGLFLMCAFSVYLDNVRTQSEEWVLGSGFALTVSAWVAAWGSGVACALQQSAEGK